MNNISITPSGSFKDSNKATNSIKRFIRNKPGFSGFVLLPTLLSTLYYTLWASPQYVSEAQFIVQGQHSQAPMMLAGLLEGGGGGSANEDTYAVQDYITSRDAAELLIRTQNLRKIYDTPAADALARFPNFYSGKTFEHFYAYYRRHIIADLDTTTGVSTLKVRSFNAQDSQKVARALVVAAEDLINKMNDRQRANTIAASTKELKEALNKLTVINEKIDSYRNDIAMLNPNLQSQPVLKDIASLQTNIITNRITLAQLQRSTPKNPLIEVYKRKITALENEISSVEKGITGSDTSFVPKISGYENLIFQRTLLEKEIATADAGVATAKLQANRQLLYLNEISSPNLPDYPAYPRSISDIAIVFATTLGLYLMTILIINGAREHKHV